MTELKVLDNGSERIFVGSSDYGYAYLYIEQDWEDSRGRTQTKEITIETLSIEDIARITTSLMMATGVCDEVE